MSAFETKASPSYNTPDSPWQPNIGVLSQESSNLYISCNRAPGSPVSPDCHPDVRKYRHYLSTSTTSTTTTTTTTSTLTVSEAVINKLAIITSSPLSTDPHIQTNNTDILIADSQPLLYFLSRQEMYICCSMFPISHRKYSTQECLGHILNLIIIVIPVYAWLWQWLSWSWFTFINPTLCARDSALASCTPVCLPPRYPGLRLLLLLRCKGESGMQIFNTSLNLGFASYCLIKLEHFLSSQLQLTFTITTTANTISSLNWRPASSLGIAKEIKNEAIGSDSGEDSGSVTSQSRAPAAWITEIQQNDLFRKVRQKIENWEKFSELCGWTLNIPKSVTWKLRILMMFYKSCWL